MKKAETVTTGNTKVTGLKKGEVLRLNNVLTGLKIGKVSKEGAFALLDAKIVLTPVVRKIEEVQKLAAEDLKPEELKKEGARNDMLEKAWNEKFVEFMNRHLDEEVSVEFSCLSRNDLFELLRENNLELGKAELLNILV